MGLIELDFKREERKVSLSTYSLNGLLFISLQLNTLANVTKGENAPLTLPIDIIKSR